MSADNKLTLNHNQLIQEGWEVVSHNIPLAIKCAQQVLSAQPSNANALHLLGWAAVQDLKFELGLSVLASAVQYAPNNGNIWRDYIRAHTLIDQPNMALRIGEQCLQNTEMFGKGVVYYALGSAYLKLGDDSQALASFERCLSLIPNHIDALSAAGMTRLRLGEGYARLGFKFCSGRSEARGPENYPFWLCPVLRGNVEGLRVLVIRSMGFGDELSYLRYLPYLLSAGAKVTYWCGSKLVPLLERLPYDLTLVPDNLPMPDPSDFDLAFIKNELPMAVEHLGAPEIADPIPLDLDQDKLKKWKNWLNAQGAGPFIGITWRAGVGGKIKDGFGFTRLAKSIEPVEFANALSGINATFVSLQRNITKDELGDFEKLLGCNVIDIAGITDDLDDLLCLHALLDENIGVSNTNMHLRASLGLGSHVLVAWPCNDWRWGNVGDYSVWFKKSTVYRQSDSGGWEAALGGLRRQLSKKYGLLDKPYTKLFSAGGLPPLRDRKIIWVTAGEIKYGDEGCFSPLSSAQERVINIAKLLEKKGWQSDFLNESVAELMGGWHDKLPIHGDVVVFSKVVTEHAITLMRDAKARGAKVVLDVFNDFEQQVERDEHQKRLIKECDSVVSTHELKNKWIKLKQFIEVYFDDVKHNTTEIKRASILEDWHQMLSRLTGAWVKDNKPLGEVDTEPKRMSNTIPHDQRVLVGMMYAGENEYELVKQALAKQTHQNHELIEIKNLSNKDAHDTLYSAFMARADEFDYFLKLDADMVFTHDNVLNDMVKTHLKYELAHLFAWVYDCPSGNRIPGIQMFRSDTKWLGSDEQLSVDYAPEVNGLSQAFTNKNWIDHMPDPDEYQLFRYGIHKALKSLQPDRDAKNINKGILHLTILNGIARNAKDNPDLWFSLIGAILVYEKEFDSIEYNGDQTKTYFDSLKNDHKQFELMRNKAENFWLNEVQVNFWWIANFVEFQFN